MNWSFDVPPDKADTIVSDLREVMADEAKKAIAETERFYEDLSTIDVARIVRIRIYRELGRSQAGLRLDDVGIMWLDHKTEIAVRFPGHSFIIRDNDKNMILSAAQDDKSRFVSPTYAVAFYLEVFIKNRGFSDD